MLLILLCAGAVIGVILLSYYLLKNVLLDIKSSVQKSLDNTEQVKNDLNDSLEELKLQIDSAHASCPAIEDALTRLDKALLRLDAIAKAAEPPGT